LTPRDQELLAFLALHRMVLPEHVAKLLDTKVETAAARLRRLAGAGYVRSEPRFSGEPAMHLITSRGLKAIGSGLGAPKVDLRGYEHDAGVAWLWLAAGGGTFGPLREIVAERQLRSHDAARDPGVEPLAVRLGGVGPRGSDRLHYPDLLLTTADGRRVALELELTSKGRVRLESILAGYGADPRIAGVVYLVQDAHIARAVETAARRVGIPELVHLQRVRLNVARTEAAGGISAERTVGRSDARASSDPGYPGHQPGRLTSWSDCRRRQAHRPLAQPELTAQDAAR
jgi:hypothetical protein